MKDFDWRGHPCPQCETSGTKGTYGLKEGRKPTGSLAAQPRQLEYGAGQYLLSSVDLPAISRIVNASKTLPLLAVAVQIDFAELKEVIQRCEALPQPSSQSGLTVFEADVEILDAVVRLLRLLDTPKHARPLGSLLRKELLYRLLTRFGI